MQALGKRPVCRKEREAEAMGDDAGLPSVSGEPGCQLCAGFSAAREFICQGISWSILLIG